MANIEKLSARPILDSRGDWTIEVALTLANGSTVRASVPRGKSTGSHEAASIPVARAVKSVEKFISPKLKGKDPRKQCEIDDMMIELDGTSSKHRLGANAILAVSVACAKAAALAEEVPLWEYARNLSGLKVRETREGVRYPRLYINVINGGLHAGNNLDFQEYLVIPKARTFRESISIGTQMYHALAAYLARSKGKNAANVGDEGGYAPDFKDNIEPFRILGRVARSLRLHKQIDFGLDAAASNVALRTNKLISMYRTFARNYPFIYLEDPFGEESFVEFMELRKILGPNVLVAGDDLTTTNISRMEEAYVCRSVDAVIIKPNQIGTVSETIDAVRLARKHGWKVIVSHRSGETNDDFIADFAVGVGADGLKLGAPARGERIAKYNRLLEIENEAHP